MDFILDRLAIGDLSDAKNEQRLKESGITAILNVAQEAYPEPNLDYFDYYKVNIDDGRLRVRTLERYLALKTLPKKPRWRNIIKTAQYVINHCNEEHEDMHKLKQQTQKLEVLAKASPHYST